MLVSQLTLVALRTEDCLLGLSHEQDPSALRCRTEGIHPMFCVCIRELEGDTSSDIGTLSHTVDKRTG